jgi:hypothetical protein
MYTHKELKEARDWRPQHEERERPKKLWQIIVDIKFLPNGNCIMDNREIDLEEV